MYSNIIFVILWRNPIQFAKYNIFLIIFYKIKCYNTMIGLERGLNGQDCFCTLSDNLISSLAFTSYASQLRVPPAPRDQTISSDFHRYLHTSRIHLHRKTICKHKSCKNPVYSYTHELTNRKLEKDKKQVLVLLLLPFNFKYLSLLEQRVIKEVIIYNISYYF